MRTLLMTTAFVLTATIARAAPILYTQLGTLDGQAVTLDVTLDPDTAVNTATGQSLAVYVFQDAWMRLTGDALDLLLPLGRIVIQFGGGQRQYTIVSTDADPTTQILSQLTFWPTSESAPELPSLDLIFPTDLSPFTTTLRLIQPDARLIGTLTGATVTPIMTTPEPATWLLIALGLVGLRCHGKRRTHPCEAPAAN